MSDLSRLLDDVYRVGPTPAPAETEEEAAPLVPALSEADEMKDTLAALGAFDVAAEAAVETDVEPAATVAGPEWASDHALDQAFVNWVPGRSVGASDVERSFLDMGDVPDLNDLPDLPDLNDLNDLNDLAEAPAPMPAPGFVDQTFDDDAPDDGVFEDGVFDDGVFEEGILEDRPVEQDLPDPALPVEHDPTFVPPVLAPWRRDHDDILPGRSGRRFSLSLSRR